MIVTTVRGINDARKRFKTMREKFPQRSLKALALARRASQVEFVAAVTDETTLNPQRAKRLLRVSRRPRVNDLRTWINVRNDPIGAQHYAVTTQAGGGIVVVFRRDKPGQSYPQAFQWKGNWFQRKRYVGFKPGQLTKSGALIKRAPSGLVGRLPVFRIEGPRLTSMLANAQEIRDRTADAGLRVLERKIREALTI